MKNLSVFLWKMENRKWKMIYKQAAYNMYNSLCLFHLIVNKQKENKDLLKTIAKIHTHTHTQTRTIR